MMNVRTGSLLVLLMTSAAPALAADLYSPPARGGSMKDGPAPAPYEPAYRYYIALRGGLAFPEDTDFNALGRNITNTYDTGYVLSGAAGVYLGNISNMRGLRGELELGYRGADVDTHTVSGVGTFSGASAFGRTGVTYGFASLYYDFDTGTSIRPFVGAGGGIADIDFKSHGVSATGTVLNDNATAYAYHLTAGFNIDLTRGLTLETAYRYFGTTGADLTAVNGTRSSVDVNDHQLMIGLRQSF
jgi:opacity protein-like surface antigen